MLNDDFKNMLKLKIVSPQRIEFEGEVERVKAPGELGQFEILTGHAPIISLLTTGDVVYVTSTGSHTVTVSGGFVEVQKNNVNFCVELAEHAD